MTSRRTGRGGVPVALLALQYQDEGSTSDEPERRMRAGGPDGTAGPKGARQVMRGRTGWGWTALLPLAVLPAVAVAACAPEPAVSGPAAVVAAQGLTAGARQTELVMSSWLPPRHPIVANAFLPWIEQIEAATEGRVTVRLLARPLGSPPSHYYLAVDGIADITYGLHSFTRDNRFPRSRFAQFSFIGDDAAAGSRAFWRVYSGRLDAQAEHEGVKLLGLFVHGPGILYNNVRRIERPADLAGLKIRTPGGYVADLMDELGATTLFMDSGDVYQKLSRGVIDGLTMTWEATTAFRLTPHLRYAMRVPGGVYNTTWYVVANEAAWRKISARDRAAIEAVSGEALAGRVGRAWNDADARAIDVIRAAGIDIYDAPPAMLDAIRSRAREHEARWTARVATRGYDGRAALAALRRGAGMDR